MSATRISRREMLKGMGLLAAGTVLAACAPAPATPEKPAEEAKPAEAPPKVEKEVILEIGASNPEYQNAERQIWDVFEAEHPGIKVKMWSVNEDTVAAFQAKVAGGYTPAFGPTWAFITGEINKENYQNFVDLSTIDFPWWDRLTHDPLHKVPELYGFGPRSIDIFSGFVFTWMYHADLMEKAGLDPRRDVKTWDDLKKFLEEGTAWAKATPEVDYFWDQGWHSWVFGANYIRMIPLAFPDGQQQDNYDCWTGKKKFNDPDSPFRHTFEFFKEAYDKGWIPENWWTREWETDMEASYIAKKSVMMLHGPWPWDKMLAADPTAEQLGFPSTPPAEGQETWVQYMGPVRYTAGPACILEKARQLPEWPQIVEAFAWYHSPKAVKMRAEVLGRPVLYKLDEPLELTGPQWVGVVKDIATPGGLWEDVQYTTGVWGTTVAGPHRKGGSPGVWDWESGAFVEQWAALMTGKKTVQEVLDWAQANWEQSYEWSES